MRTLPLLVHNHAMRVDLLTREYPPEVYGGAGVHVEYLARELRRLVDVRVHCMGGPRSEEGVTAYDVPAGLADANAALRTLGTDLTMAAGCEGTDLVHSHTWYANIAGHLAGLLHGVPHVMSAHSLEPLRPWKAEQLGGGYALSSWAERTAVEAADAVIAVSAGMRDDLLSCYPDVDAGRVHVVHNGIDTEEYQPDTGTDVLQRHGIDPDRPVGGFRRAGSPARRACRTCCAPPCPSTRRCSWSSAPEPPTPTRSWPRSPSSWRSCAATGTASCGCSRCCPSRTSSRS